MIFKHLRAGAAPFLGILFGLVPALSAAVTYEVVDVLNSTDGNFQFSVLHTADPRADNSAPMSGDITDRIVSVDMTSTRTFILDESTNKGDLDVTLALNIFDTSTSNGTMALTGELDFLGTDPAFLETQGSLEAIFSGSSHTNTAFNFAPGSQCCDSAGDDRPNSFVTVGDFAYLTLWGANGDLVGDTWTSQTNIDGAENLGIDLRLKLRVVTEDASVVPIPAAFWLFGSALLGFVAIARRNERRQTLG